MQTRDNIANTMNAEETLSLIQDVLKKGLDEKITLEQPKGVSKKFYRIRGWEQRKKFLKDVNEEIAKYEQ